MGVRHDLNTAYSRLKMRESYRRRKQQAVEYKGGKCELCGYSKSLAALDFHHRDPDGKDFQIAGTRRTIEGLQAELDKCSLLCANCHREEHERLMQEAHNQLRQELRRVIPERSPQRTKIWGACQWCGCQFESYESSNQKFCGRKCQYAAQLGFQWPPDEELARLVSQQTVAITAKKLGTTPKSVRCRLLTRQIPWEKWKNSGRRSTTGSATAS